MSVSSHVEELQKKHQRLSAEVEAAERSPSFDQVQINTMKRRKLMLKDRIQQFEH